MKINHKVFVIVSLIIGLISLNCNGENPVIDLSDPSTFPGTYKIVSITDITGADYGQAGLTVTAGEPTTITVQEGDINLSMTLTLTGSLTLTDSRYTFSQTIKMSFAGLAEETETVDDAGTYTIAGSTITIASDNEDDDPETGTISVNKNEMTLEFEDQKVVLEKQS